MRAARLAAAAALIILGIVVVMALTTRDSDDGGEVDAGIPATEESVPAPAALVAESPTATPESSAPLVPPTAVATAAPQQAVLTPQEEVAATADSTWLCVVDIGSPDVLSLRAAPSIDAEVLAELGPGRCGIRPRGDAVDDWTPVIVDIPPGDELAGWVSSAFVVSAQESFVTTLLQDQYCVVGITSPDVLNVRAGPTTDLPVLVELGAGECQIFLAGEEADGWVQVFVTGGDRLLQGWVSARFVAAPRASVVAGSPTTLISVTVTYNFDPAESEPPIENFQVVDSAGLVIGQLDNVGQLSVPDELLADRLRVQAEFPSDPFCAWTGDLRFEGFEDRYTAELFAICA